MNINKLNKAFENIVKDKYGQSLEVNDVVLFSKGNSLTEGIILNIQNDSVLLHNRDTFIKGSEVVLINDLYNKKGLNTNNIINNYNNNQKLNNTIYLFYAIFNGEEGFIFFKPTYQGAIGFINDYQLLMNKFKDIIILSFKSLYIAKYDYFDRNIKDLFKSIDIEKIIEDNNMSIHYNAYIPFIVSSEYYIGTSVKFSDLLKINTKMKNHWFTRLKFKININEFIPISFNHTLDNKISLELANNSIENSFICLNYPISELYNTLKFTYTKIIPTIIKNFNLLPPREQKTYNCYYQLNELNIKNNYF